jgi:hypothetical protein
MIDDLREAIALEACRDGLRHRPAVCWQSWARAPGGGQASSGGERRGLLRPAGLQAASLGAAMVVPEPGGALTTWVSGTVSSAASLVTNLTRTCDPSCAISPPPALLPVFAAEAR